MSLNIGIIGAGLIGSVLAREWVKQGHHVEVANSRGPSSSVLQGVAASTGATAVEVLAAAKDKDVVVVTIPFGKVPDLPASLFEHTPANAVVIDTNNYYPFRDGPLPEINDGGQLDSDWVSQHLGGRPVVKAFNNIMYFSLSDNGKPAGTPGRIALPVAGDNEQHRKIVLDLVDKLGFEPVDVGPIANSWRHEPGTPAYCHDLDKDALEAALAQADRSKRNEYRADADAKLADYLAALAAKAAN